MVALLSLTIHVSTQATVPDLGVPCCGSHCYPRTRFEYSNGKGRVGRAPKHQYNTPTYTDPLTEPTIDPLALPLTPSSALHLTASMFHHCPIPPFTLPSIHSPTQLPTPPSTLSSITPSNLSPIPPWTLSPISAGPSCAQLVNGIVASGPDLSAGGEHWGVGMFQYTTPISPKDIPFTPRHNNCPSPHTFLCCSLDCQYVPSLSHSSIDPPINPSIDPLVNPSIDPRANPYIDPRANPSTLLTTPPSLLSSIPPSTLSLITPSTLSPIPPSTLSPISAGPSCAQLVDGIVASGPDLSAGGECTTHLSHPKDVPSPPRHNACPPPHTFLCCPLDCQYVPSLSLSSTDTPINPLAHPVVDVTAVQGPDLNTVADKGVGRANTTLPLKRHTLCRTQRLPPFELHINNCLGMFSVPIPDT